MQVKWPSLSSLRGSAHAPRVLVAAAGLLGVGIAWWFALPRPLFDAPYSTVIEANDGKLLGAQIASDGQWRFPPVNSVSPRFRRALIEYEDRNFDRHLGIDPRGVARAFYQNAKERRVVSGGSTLTMQVLRMARGREGSRWGDKLIEIVLAPRLELSYSKDEIVALYAAHAPFGGNVVGLEAASWRYFGRPPTQLSWAEACTLAVLPNSPGLVHPGRQRDRLRDKRDRLLRQLQARGELSALDLQLSLAEPLIGEPRSLPQLAPHLLATLHSQRPAANRIVTTLDNALQQRINDVIARHAEQLARQDIHNAALIVIDNRNFTVSAYVGNTLSQDDARGHAVDIVRRPRSTGSVLKPFLYAAMLESGDLLPKMLVPDVPTQIAGYIPENFDRQYRGAVPADMALAQSLNVPAVRMLRTFGVPRFYDSLKQLGLTTLVRTPDDYGLTLILGGAEGNLWDITSGYANLAQLARDGVAGQAPMYRTARVVLTDKESQRRATDIGPGSAWLALQALLDVARPAEEGQWRDFTDAHPIAWKTGTSWGLRDAWAVGTSARYTVGVWVGNATGEGRPGLTGASAAAPILFDAFRQLKHERWIAPPRWDLKQVQVCKNDGYLVNGDCDSIVQRIPREAQPMLRSPHNALVHLDGGQRYRVDSSCESVGAMTHASWFVLPPAQEYFYRKAHANYRLLPDLRGDCARIRSARAGAMDFLYPNADTRVYIPLDFGAQRGRVVFEAVHRDTEATLHWHIDRNYMGDTHTFHQLALDLSPGTHIVTIVDQTGESKSRRFEVLGVTADVGAHVSERVSRTAF
ncbi:MAG TPA: penicillin-binding protein 1C [Steroidobacteraceae bacterium]|nr:penicillin-binding protein 1C [Steroidobacteraceae bacterium]